MKQKRTILLACLMLLLTFVVAGCQSGAKTESGTAGQKAYLTIKDDAGRTVALPNKPQRIVVLSSSYLDLLYSVGGTAVGRPSSKTPHLFPESEQATEIGFVYNVNMEQVTALKPDLVIGFQGIHEKLIPMLESNHTPFVLLRMKSYEDVVEKAKLFGEIAGTQAKAAELIQQMGAKREAVIAKLPAASKKVVILHATAKSVTVELETSIAGSIAKTLKLKNIAAGSKPIDGDNDITPYSLETLVAADPDMVLVVTMGNMQDIEKRLQKDIQSNPAWAGLRAVKNGQIVFLPPERFQLNPGVKIDESIEYMAKAVYPEVYGHVE